MSRYSLKFLHLILGVSFLFVLAACQPVDETPQTFSISSISPASGDVTGGYTATISGKHFAYITSVEFDGVPCTDVNVSASEITCTVPAKTTPGAVIVSIKGKANRSESTTFTYNLGTPTVTSFSPAISPLAGGSSVFVYGTGFATGTTVAIGGTDCSAINVLSSTLIECVTPANVAGTYSVVATNTNGMTGTAPGTFTYYPAPTITSVSPAFGSNEGGATITLTGTGFLSGIRVLIGNSVCGAVSVASSTSLTCVTAMSSLVGASNIRIINPDTQTVTLTNGFTFHAPPLLTTITPSAGALAGGTTITINGTNFTASTTFEIGGTPCATTVVSATQMTCVTPPRAAGSYVVSVYNPGTSTSTISPGYSYQGAPSVSGVNPSAGPLAGGTAVVITGLNFKTGATVSIGGTACAVTASNATSITCTSAAKSAGSYVVTVTNTDNQSGSLAGGFTYQPAPDVTSISPVVASVSGGTNITITGTDFVTGVTATIGGHACTPVSATPPTSFVCTTVGPFAAGTGDIIVNNPDGQSDTLTAGITFLAPPAITTVLPSAGALGGLTTITIAGTDFFSGLAVTVDGVTCDNPILTGTTTITCETRAHAAATVDVAVINPDGQTDIEVASYTYQPAPTVSGIAPANGPATISQTVTISGNDFLSGATVDIGGSACSGVIVVDPNTITCSTSTHAAGTATVSVRNADAQTGTFSSYTYDPVPTITSISPSSVPASTVTSITINGTNFVSAPTVTVNSGPCINVVYVSATQITCDAPSLAAGAYDVQVTNPDFQTVVSTGGITYLNPPTVSSVSPTAGPLAGGNTITVTGTDFVSGSAIDIGGTTCPTTFVNSTTLTCLAPAKAAAAYIVTVTNPDSATATDSYTYQPAPTVSSVTAPNGVMTGGTPVVITGSGFISPSAVSFGGSACTITSSNATQVACTTTAHAAGAVTVSVTNGDGQIGTLASGYTFDAGPDIANISPILGPTAGGTTLTLNGSGFVSGATVSVGGINCTPVTFVSSAQVTCSTGSTGTAGAQTILITNPDGQSDTYSSFTYLAPPALTSIAPNGGPPAGGTAVQINGSGFQSGVSVTFGGAACTGVTVVNSSTITCTTPSGTSGAANVVVTNFDGQTGSSAALYSYNNPPLVSNVTPNIGPIGGGTSVTIAGSGFISGATATFGSSSPVACTFVSVNALTCTTPLSVVSGGVSVKVTNPDTQSNTLATGFVYLNPPTISSISPSLSRLAGGATATITGSGFFAGATVMINGNVCTGPNVVNSTTITCVIPASGIAGSYDVVVTNVDSQQATLVGGFTYQSAPTLTSVSPNNGHYNGGMTITLTGTNFVAGASVTIGGVSCGSVNVVNSTSITCVTSAGTNGTYAVHVTNTDSQTNSVTQNYTYRSAPVVSNVTNGLTPFPAYGRASVSGTVKVNGSGFFAGDTVTIGTQACTSPTVVSQNQITCTYPVQAAGVYSVTVTSPDRTGTLANAFRYRDDPTITSVSPNSGVQAGNTLITITGTNFFSGAAVEFGAVSTGTSANDCTSVTVVSPTTITCRTPAGSAGAFDVIVEHPLMPNAVSTNGYTYTATPILGFVVGSSSPNPPNPDSFGSTTTNVTHTYTVKNTGEGPTTAMTVSIGGTNPGAFLKGTDNCDGMILGIGSSCTIQMTFLGGFLTTGSYSATLQVTATSGGTTTNTLQGSVP